MTARIDGLEVDENLPLQRKEWAVQRVGWALMLALVAAAMLGLFGSGVLSEATAGEEGGALWVRYARFWRSEAPHTVRLHADPDAIEDGTLRVWVDAEYIRSSQLRWISPPPERVSLDGERLVYEFAANPSDEPFSVDFNLEPQTVGPREARIGLVDGPDVRLWQFVYP